MSLMRKAQKLIARNAGHVVGTETGLDLRGVALAWDGSTVGRTWFADCDLRGTTFKGYSSTPYFLQGANLSDTTWLNEYFFQFELTLVFYDDRTVFPDGFVPLDTWIKLPSGALRDSSKRFALDQLHQDAKDGFNRAEMWLLINWAVSAVAVFMAGVGLTAVLVTPW